MRCADAREALLTGEPEELRGVGDSELSTHVRTCAECAAAARQILGITAALAVRLDQLATPSRSRKLPNAWPVWVALPIAAALAGLMLVREPDTQTLPRVGALEDVKQPVVHPVVNAPANRNVAVIEAANNITVVWDLGAKGGS